MDFGFDETQQELVDLAARIIGDHATPTRLKELEAGSERVDRELWSKLADANLLGVALGEDVGGSGYGIMELCLLLAEAGRRVAPVPLYATVCIAALPIDRFGSADLRKELLPRVVDGSLLLTAALQEPANRDPLAPTTTATRIGDGWRLAGQKVAVPWATVAERILVTATTAPGSVGLFLVDPGGPGVTLERAEATHREPQGVLTLSDALVDSDAVVGDPEAGTTVVEWLCQHALAGLCATALGVCEEALQLTAAYISEREQFGRPIATFQGATLRAADAYIDTQAISVATWSAVWRLASGRRAADELAIAKFWAAEGGQRVLAACQHLHGGIGVDIDYPIHRYFLWAKELELTLGGATDQLLRLGASLAGR